MSGDDANADAGDVEGVDTEAGEGGGGGDAGAGDGEGGGGSGSGGGGGGASKAVSDWARKPRGPDAGVGADEARFPKRKSVIVFGYVGTGYSGLQM